MNWIASGNISLPIARTQQPWDREKARERIFRWAGFDKPTPSKRAMKAFFIVDRDNWSNPNAYLLPFTDVINGELMIVPQAVDEVSRLLLEGSGHSFLTAEIVDRLWRKINHLSYKIGLPMGNRVLVVPQWPKTSVQAPMREIV